MWEVTVKWRGKEKVILSDSILIDDYHVIIHPYSILINRIPSSEVLSIIQCK